ncbi:MAG: pilus assembly protein [Pirellulales bacterium]|nr:pilus assembly protein [Pirellulales bacterium]
MVRSTLLACLPWLAILLASLFVLLVLAKLNRARPRIGRLRRLHADQRGSSQSLAFVLTLPLFVMVLLLIVQVGQLMIAQMVVEYAAFAAARAAAVWIPADLSMHSVEEGPNRVGGYDLVPAEADAATVAAGSVYRLWEYGLKYGKIRRAALLGCMSICPSRDLGIALSGDAAASADSLANAYNALTQTSDAAAARRLRNKFAYAAANTKVEVEFFHSDDEPPPNAAAPTKPVNLIGAMSYDCYIIMDDETYDLCFRCNEVGWRDPITVRITHNLALLPGPGRLLARSTGAADRVSSGIENRGDVYTYPLSASATIGNEGEVSRRPYVY